MRAIFVFAILAISFAALLFQALRSRMDLPDHLIDRVQLRSGPTRMQISGTAPQFRFDAPADGYSKYV